MANGKHSYTSPEAIRRGLWLIEMVEKTGLMLDSDSTVLEVGTGWTHFYGIFLHFFYSPKTYLFDVWDNRQLEALKAKYNNLYETLVEVLPTDKQKHLGKIQDMTQKIGSIHSFDELYRLLDMVYCLEPEGKLDMFPSNTFDLVFSGDVMEHIHKNNLDTVIQNFSRTLKPGGVSIHQIGIDDHLTHYALGTSTKNYIRYSEKTWKLFFENKVQYFNRVQLPDYLEAFERSGFQLYHLSTEQDLESLRQFAPAPEFQRFDSAALQTTRAYLVHMKAR